MASPTVRARLNWLNSPNSMARETSDPLVRFLQSLGGLHLIVSSASWASASFVPFSTLSRSIYSWKPSLDLPTTLAHTCRFYLRAGIMGERLHHIEHIKQFSKANLDSPALKCFGFFFVCFFFFLRPLLIPWFRGLPSWPFYSCRTQSHSFPTFPLSPLPSQSTILSCPTSSSSGRQIPLFD